MSLKTERNTQAIDRRIRACARDMQIGSGHYETDFEHGQWWITDLRTGAQWSVVDAEGGRSVDGFDFEQVTYGEDE